MKRLALASLRFYKRAVSPLLPPSCRFTPTCSEYAYQAVEQHGVLRGSWLALGRILRCHPLSRGGHDPVPPARAMAASGARSMSLHSAGSARSERSDEQW